METTYWAAAVSTLTAGFTFRGGFIDEGETWRWIGYRLVAMLVAVLSGYPASELFGTGRSSQAYLIMAGVLWIPHFILAMIFAPWSFRESSTDSDDELSVD